MMKLFSLSCVFLLLFLSCAVAEIKEGLISYETPDPNTKIIKDVPFPVTVKLNSQGEQVSRIQLYLTSTDKNVKFLKSKGLAMLSASTVNQNELKEEGNIWWYNVGPKGDLTGASEVPLAVITVEAKTTASKAVLTLTDKDNKIYVFKKGDAVVNIPKGGYTITPQLSQCGDGVVGYFDTNTNGIKDAGEAEEVCDSADGKNTDDVTKVVKCVDCKYVAIGYQPVNCGFGSYGCTIKKMTSQELFLARITALVNKACYPDANHPAAEFCKDKKPIEYYTDNKIEGERKLEFIVQVGRILKEFFTGLPN